MNSNQNTEHELFHEYYNRWIHIYKEDAIRNVTIMVKTINSNS